MSWFESKSRTQKSQHGFCSEYEIITQRDKNSKYALKQLKPGPNETYSDKYKKKIKSCLCSANCLFTIFPIIQWLPTYKLSWLKLDIMAAITVSILLVPQALAYAVLAGLPPEWGLYASVVPVIVYTIWSTSTKVAVGPGAPTAIMVASAVEGVMLNLDISTSDQQYNALYQSIAMTFSFVCGIIFIIFGLIRAGFVIVFLSRPVQTGFIMSAAFIILINQFRALLGLEIDRYPRFFETLIAVLSNLNTIHWYTTLISLISLIILFLPKCCLCVKIPKWVPIPLIVIILNILISYFADFESLGVDIVGSEIKSGFPIPSPPNFHFIPAVFPSAVIVTIVSFMGNIALAKGFEQKTKETYQQQLAEYNIFNESNNNTKPKTEQKSKSIDDENAPVKPINLPNIDVSANMEFIAYGMANLIGSFFSCQVVSASFSRTALNVEMNGHSQLSALLRVLICIFCLLFLMPLLSPLPKCVLAAVVTVSVHRLIKNGVNELKFLWLVSRIELIEFLLSFISPLLFGLEIGIFLSIATSIIVNLLRHSFTGIIFLGRLQSTISDDAEYVDCQLFKQAKYIPHITIIEMKAELAFTNNSRLLDKIRKLLAGGNKYIVVSLNLTSFIDTTSIRQIVTIFEDAKGSYICLAQCRPKVMTLIRRYQKDTDDFPPNIKTFVLTHDAVRYLQSIRSNESRNRSYAEDLSCLSEPSLDNICGVTPQMMPSGDSSTGCGRKRMLSDLDIAHLTARKHTFSIRGSIEGHSSQHQQLDSESDGDVEDENVSIEHKKWNDQQNDDDDEYDKIVHCLVHQNIPKIDENKEIEIDVAGNQETTK